MARFQHLLPSNSYGSTLLIIEAKAVSKALQFATELYFNRVILEGDCHVLMKALKEDSNFLSTDGLFIDDVCFDAKLLINYVTLMYRECNKVVHSLA